MARELTVRELKRFSINDIKKLGIKNTGDISLLHGLIGQERAANALKFGLDIKQSGYNIYISGNNSTGRTTFAKSLAEQQAINELPPDDLVYVYNFNDPNCPQLISFCAGKGKIFANEVDELCEQLKLAFNRAFSDKNFDENKKRIQKTYQQLREEIVAKITNEAKEKNFGVKMTNTGIFFMPVVEGEPITEEQFEALSDNEKKEISQKSEEIQDKAASAMFEIKTLETTAKKDIEELNFSTALFVIGKHLAPLIEKYAKNETISCYLLELKEDMLENYDSFLESEEDDEQTVQNVMPWMLRRSLEAPLNKYRVNLFTDNSELSCAPVILSFNPSYSNMLGETEYDSEYGNLTTDFMKIKSGLLHKANGGYLILQEEDVLTNSAVWELIKKVAKSGEISFEPQRELMTGIAISRVKPKPIKLNIKFIIVGSYLYHSLLSEHDTEFSKLFKINVMFDSEFKYNNASLKGVLSFIRSRCTEEKLRTPTITALAALVDYFVRLTESKNKITSSFDIVQDMLIEADYCAKKAGTDEIDAVHVKEAVDQMVNRSDLYEEKLDEQIESNTVMIDTDGFKIGQINGLSVIMSGNHVFGKPSRITTTTYMGKAGLINIEKEAELSGAIHDKGIEVISGYLGQTYAQDFPLSLSCRICFEQNYGGIDGDSASSTELYAVISSLSDCPLNQGIAVTGSVNQRGEIQAIGGVTAKIEGFYDLCKSRSLTGNQGVIIPEQNVQNLMLKAEVLEAVKAKKFHIYAVTTIDEGLEILTGKKAGKMNGRGKFPADSIHGKAYKKLKAFHEKSIDE